VYGGRDVLVRVGRRRLGLGVAKAVEGVGGGGDEGVPLLTFYHFIARSVFR
jgi:hypothetical protein